MDLGSSCSSMFYDTLLWSESVMHIIWVRLSF